MEVNVTEIGAFVGGFVWPLARIGAMLMVMPIFGTQLISIRIRVVLAAMFTFLVIPSLPPLPAVDPLSAASLVIIFQQVLIGVIFGFVFQLVFQAFIVGGQVIAMQMGLGFASLMDPQSGVSVPLVSQVFLMMVTLIFMALDGHLIVFQVLVNSFYTIPIANDGLSMMSVWQLLEWAKIIFNGAILIALPAIVSLLLVNISFGVISRAAPQINIFVLGFPMTLTLGLFIVYFMLSGILIKIEMMFNSGFNMLQQMAT